MALPEGGGASSKVRTRYPGIDILRGLALVSMVSSHVTHYRLTTVIGTVFHSGKWIDGAFLFVALSGVVVGLIHRRIVERAGLRPSLVKLTRRAGFLYLVHVLLTLLAITAAWVHHDNTIVGVPALHDPGSIPRVIARVLFLRLEPEDNGVLPIYVVFMLLAIPAVVLLRRGRWQAVVLGSLAIYSFSWIVGGLSFVPDEFQPGAWQLLFMGGLLVGWTWEHERFDLPLYWRDRILVVCFAGAAAFLSLALVAPGHGQRYLGHLLDKLAGGPAAFLYAGMVMVTGYVLLDQVLRWQPAAALLTPVRILGSKGLPGYAALQAAVVFLDLLPHAPRNDLVVLAVTAICGVTEYSAVKLQQRRRQQQRPLAVTSAADTVGTAGVGQPRFAPAVATASVPHSNRDGTRVVRPPTSA